MQPNFSWDVENYKDRLGADVEKINPFRSILDGDVELIFGSDDMPSTPLKDIAWATTDVPFLNQKITFKEALDAYTIKPAKVAGRLRGKFAKGYMANFIVFEENPLEILAGETRIPSVKETWIQGVKVF